MGETSESMRLLSLLLLVAIASAAKGGKQAARKQTRKEFRKCKNQNCKERCPCKAYLNSNCYSCLDEAQCPLPKRIKKAVKCAKNECDSNCTEDLFNNECMECRVTNCENKSGRGQNSGRPHDPLFILRKYVSGNGRNRKLAIADGTRALHRCALGMCYKQCVLEPVNEKECEECVTTLCTKASENYSCVAAERKNKFFFCSTAVDCTGPDAGGVKVGGQDACPPNSFCCHWGEK